MQRDEVLQTLAAHKSELDVFRLRSLALFGSAARNEACQESDLDFVVEFEGPATFDRYIELSFYLESLFRQPIDLLTQASLTPTLRAAIENETCYVPGFSPIPR